MAKDDVKTEFKLVGTRVLRHDGLDKVTGRARYGADFSLPGMLFGAVVRSPHAHARIKRIDASKALALDGVKAVVTRADFPEGLSGENWNLQENTMAGEVALYDGHAVAAVAATSALLAQDAARLVEVEYEVLPHVTDVDAAMQPDAPAIRAGSADPSVPEGMHPNVVRRLDSGRGAIEAGSAAADPVREPSATTEASRRGDLNARAGGGPGAGGGSLGFRRPHEATAPAGIPRFPRASRCSPRCRGLPRVGIRGGARRDRSLRGRHATEALSRAGPGPAPRGTARRSPRRSAGHPR